MAFLQGLKSMFGGGRLNVANRFELMRKAVSGSMSKFHMARDRKSGEIVGLKILDEEKTEQFESRFPGLKKPSEGEIAVRLDHPNIVKTFEHGWTTDGEQYLVMEFLEGTGLNSLIIGRSEKLNGHRLKLLRQAAKAIDAVHEAGYIHRDICPRNFVVSADLEKITLIDFGLTVPAEPVFMQPGNRTGTPNYMAPEIVRRRRTDQRVDVFAFGVTAYALYTFELPWSGGTTGKAAMNHDTVPPIDIRRLRPTIEPRLAAAIMKCLQARPEDRPTSMKDFLAMIESVECDDTAR